MRCRYRALTFLFVIIYCHRVQINEALKSSCKYNRVAKYKRILQQSRWTPFAQYNLDEISRFTTILHTWSYSLPAYIHDPELHPKVRWRQPFRQTVLSGIKITDLVKPSLHHDNTKKTPLGESGEIVPPSSYHALGKCSDIRHCKKRVCLKEEIIFNYPVLKKHIFKNNVILICTRDPPVSSPLVGNSVINKTVHQTAASLDNAIINGYGQKLPNSHTGGNVQNVKIGSNIKKNLASKPSFTRTTNEAKTPVTGHDDTDQHTNPLGSHTCKKKYENFIRQRHTDSLSKCNTMSGMSSDLSELSTVGWVILLSVSFILPSLIIKLCYHWWSKSLESLGPCTRATPNKKLRTRKRNRRNTRPHNGNEGCILTAVTDLAEPAPEGCFPECVQEEEDDELLDDEMSSSFPVDIACTSKPMSPLARTSKGITDASLASADVSPLKGSNPKHSQINSSQVSFSSLSERILKIHHIGKSDDAMGHGSMDGLEEKKEQDVEKASLSRYSIASSNSSEEIIQITNVQPCLQSMTKSAATAPLATVQSCLQSHLHLTTVSSRFQSDLPSVTVSSRFQSDLPSVTVSSGFQSDLPLTTVLSGFQSDLPSVTVSSGWQSDLPLVTVSSGFQSDLSSVTVSSGWQSDLPSVTVSSGLQSDLPSVTVSPGWQSDLPSVTVSSGFQIDLPSVTVLSGWQSDLPSVTVSSGWQSDLPSVTVSSGWQSDLPSVTVSSGWQSDLPSVTVSSGWQSDLPSVKISSGMQSDLPLTTKSSYLQRYLALTTISPGLQSDLPLTAVSLCLQSDTPLVVPSHPENECCSSTDCHLLYCSHTVGSSENDTSLTSSSSSSHDRCMSTETSMNSSSSGDDNQDGENIHKEMTGNVLPAIICNTDEDELRYFEVDISVADHVDGMSSNSTAISDLSADKERNINNYDIYTNTNANANYGCDSLNSSFGLIPKSDQKPKNDNKIDVFSETFEEPVDSIRPVHALASNSNLTVDICQSPNSSSHLHDAEAFSLSSEYVVNVIEHATHKRILLPVYDIIFLLASATGISRYVSRHLVLGQYFVAIANKEHSWIKRVLDECMLPELTTMRDLSEKMA